MTSLSELSRSGQMFLLGNHGCCGVPGIGDHTKEGLERSWLLGQGALVDVIVNNRGKVLMSHHVDTSLTEDDAVLFEDAAVWAGKEKTFLCLNLLQAGKVGGECAAQAIEIACANDLAFAISSADSRLLRQLKSGPNGFDTVYAAGGYAEVLDQDPIKDAVKARCKGIIIDCGERDYDWIEDLFQKNGKRKKNRMAFLAHIGSDFECALWCARLGMGCVCDDPLEAINAILKYGY